MYDLSTKKLTNVTTSSSNQFGMNLGSTSVGSYDIYGDNIVYVNDSGSSDMSGIGTDGSTGGVPCIYSISKGKITQDANETQAGNIAI